MTSLPPHLPTLFKHLLGLLAGPDYEVRRAALVALSRLRGQMAAEIVFERFQSDNLEDYLMLTLNALDADRAGKTLVAALSDPHLEVRLRAAEALASKPTEESLFALTSAVENYLNRNKASATSATALMTEESLLGAAKALGDIGTPMCLSLLRKMVLQETNSRIRATAVAALCNKPNDSLIPVLQGLLKDPDARVRANAIEGFQKLDKPSVIGLLQPYLYDPHQRVRANAAKAIWKFGDYEVTATIREMLASKDKKQLVSGIYAAGEIKVAAFLKNLTAFLYHQDADVRRNAVIALKKFGKTDYSREFPRMVEDPTIEVRIQAALALAETLPETAPETLLARLAKEPEAGVRAVLVGQLGRVGKDACLIPLAKYLDDPDERVAVACIEALVRLKPQEPPSAIVLPIDRFRKGKNRTLMRRAILALWRWGFSEALESLCAELASSDPEAQASALQAAGEIFAETSATGGEAFSGFDQTLRQMIDEVRKTQKQASSEANEKRIQDLIAKAQDEIKSGRLFEARGTLEEVLELVPNHLPAWLSRGDLCLAAGELDEAEASYRKAIEIAPNTVKAQFGLGQVHCRKGEWDKALRPLELSLRLYPKLLQAYLLLADALENLSRYPDAREVLARVRKITAPNPALQQRYARVCFLAGGVGEAVQVSQALAGKIPVDQGTRVILAVGDALQGEGVKAFQSLLKVLGTTLENGAGKLPAYFPRLLGVAEAAIARSLEGPALILQETTTLDDSLEPIPPARPGQP